MKKMIFYASNAACLVAFVVILVLAPMLFLPLEMIMRILITFGLIFAFLGVFAYTNVAALQATIWPTLIMLPVMIFISIKGTRMAPLFLGLPAFIFLIVLGVQWMFYNARDSWQTFADKHGLKVTGLDVDETPYMEGEWRGVPIEVMLVFDPENLGVSEENISMTVVKAHFEPPIEHQMSIEHNGPDFTINTTDAELRTKLQQDEEASSTISAFYQTYPNFGTINETGLSAADFNFLKPARVEKMLNHCVDTLLVLQKHL